MSKTLIADVKDLIKEVDKTHRYSMSRIYGLYNMVFDKQEEPQSCASCLIRKVRELRDWLESKGAKEGVAAPMVSLEEGDVAPKPTKSSAKKKK